MPDSKRAVAALVAIATDATKKPSPKALRSAVSDVLDALEGAGPKDTRAAITSLGAALGNADGRGAQIICLVLGALVEGGASPDLAWEVVGDDLDVLFEDATDFARTCVVESGEETVEAALSKVGRSLAKAHPSEAAAWDAIPSRSLAAVACLTRSPKLRKRARGALYDAAFPLEDAVAEVGLLTQVLRILDGESLVVVHPGQKRGFRVTLQDVVTNLDLLVLLADALAGDPAKGKLPGKRPDAKALAVLRGEGGASFEPPFELLAWSALGASDDDEPWLPLDGLPADIPELDGERVVLLAEPTSRTKLAIEPSFSGLDPSLTAKALAPKEVARLLERIAKKTTPRPAKGAKVTSAKTPAKATKAKATKAAKAAKTPKTKTKTKTAKSVPSKPAKTKAAAKKR